MCDVCGRGEGGGGGGGVSESMCVGRGGVSESEYVQVQKFLCACLSVWLTILHLRWFRLRDLPVASPSSPSLPS